MKLALTSIPDPNRSTAINLADVNGRSLYIVHYRTAVLVEGVLCPAPCKKGLKLSGRGNVRRDYVRIHPCSPCVDCSSLEGPDDGQLGESDWRAVSLSVMSTSTSCLCVACCRPQVSVKFLYTRTSTLSTAATYSSTQ